MELRNERDLPKLFDNGNNLKELLNEPRFGNTYTALIAEIGTAGQWVKVLQQTERFSDSNLTGCSLELVDPTLLQDSH